MGTIVTLPTRKMRRASVQGTGEATILLFMGVRYVRDFEPAEQAQAEPAADRTIEPDLPALEIA